MSSIPQAQNSTKLFDRLHWTDDWGETFASLSGHVELRLELDLMGPEVVAKLTLPF